ncbi:MAG: hypothetical protein FWE25_02580 [Lachnospiraceae bacterium]|nr:hypothetical protein [Lachnospiraceae bacterium]
MENKNTNEFDMEGMTKKIESMTEFRHVGDLEAFPDYDLDDKKKEKPNKTVAIVVLVSSLAVIIFGVISFFYIIPNLLENQEAARDREAAYAVMHLIETHTRDVTIDSERDLELIRGQYFALTDAQKALVENAADLTDALAYVQLLQDRLVAEELIAAIDFIHVNSLTVRDAEMVQSLRDHYNSLTFAQRQLVTNYEKIAEFEEAILLRAAEEQNRQIEAEQIAAEQEAQQSEEIEEEESGGILDWFRGLFTN